MHKKIDRLTFLDWYFIFIVIILPSSFFALINQNLFYIPGLIDLNFIVFLASMPFLLFISKINKLWRFRPTKYLIISCLYVLIIFLKSIFIDDINIREIITVIRTNFLFGFQTIALLLYLVSINSIKKKKIFDVILLLTVLQASLFIIVNITGLDIYSASYKENISYQGKEIVSNLFAVPAYFIPYFFYFLILKLTGNSKKIRYNTPLIIILLFVTQLLTFVRSGTVVFIIGTFIVIFLTTIKLKKTYISKSIGIIILLTISIFSYLMLYPQHFDRFKEKWGFENTTALNKIDYTNYDFRKELNETAISQLQYESKEIFGFGYERYSYVGNYDFVLGTDTLIAPVLYTEGFLGLILRLLPILFLFSFCIKKYLRFNNIDEFIYSLVGIVIISTSVINYVQTKVFVFYHIDYFFIVGFLILNTNYNSNKILK